MIIFRFIGKIINYIQNHFKAMLFLLLLFVLFAPFGSDKLQTPNLETIILSGEIGNIDKVMVQINQATRDKNIKGVLLKVDSPGGALAPSIELSMAIKRLSHVKPVIAYASGSMASGSYYASIWANKIIANPGAFIGSIGVLFQAPNIEELAKKIGISEQIVTAGTYKQMGTFTRKWTPKEKSALTNLINDAYAMFIKDVSNARGLNPKNYKNFADAKVFMAAKAKKVGLIDEVGSIYTAQKELIKMANIKKPLWQKPDMVDEFLKELKASSHITINLENLIGQLK
jgi:protease-4